MKTRILLFLSFFAFASAPAQVAGPNNPTIFINGFLDGYTRQWSDLSNVQSEDENYATFGNLEGASGTHTSYLMVTDFGFQIPPGTIIEGIKVEVRCADPNSRTSDYSVRIVKTGSIMGDEKATGNPYPLNDDYLVYGGSGDLWGETWDYKFIDDNQFGVAIAAQRNNDDDISTDGRVDNIRITVYYTFMTLPISLNSFTATLHSKTVELNWKTTSENNINNFKLERSADGRSFNTIATLSGQNIPVATYSYNDNNPLPGISYYRLNIQGTGFQKYSPVVSVKNNQASDLSIYPSLWQKGDDLNITNHAHEKLTVYFFNAGGQIISTVTTDTKIVPTETLAGRNGLVFYRILDVKKNILGNGQLLVQ